MKNYYDSIAQGYNELYREEQLKKLKIVLQNLKIKKTDKLLDVGCGTFFSSEYIKCRCCGIDPSGKLLKLSKNRNIKKASAEKIPFPENYFDIVISLTAVQNFLDIEKGLKEIKRVSNDKGQIAITFLKKSSKKDKIIKLIKKHFKINKEIEEQKDLIFILNKQ